MIEWDTYNREVFESQHQSIFLTFSLTLCRYIVGGITG